MEIQEVVQQISNPLTMEIKSSDEYLMDAIEAFDEALLETDVEPHEQERLAADKSKEESKEEPKEGDAEKEEKDGEGEPKEEPKVEVPPEVTELQGKLEKAEKQSKQLMRRLKQEGDRVKAAEERLKTLDAPGVEVARSLIAAARSADYNQVYKLLGMDPEKVVDHYAKFLKQPEEVKAEMKKREETAAKARIAQQEADLAQKQSKFQIEGILNKFADKLPILSSMGKEAVDQVFEVTTHMLSAGDPRMAGVTTAEEAFKRTVKYLEKANEKKFAPIVEVFNKRQPKAPEAKPVAAPEKKPEPSKVAKAEQKKPAKLPARSTPVPPATPSRQELSEDRIRRALEESGI